MTMKGTPLSRPLRAWLGVEVLFGVAAVLAIGVAPENSSSNFAWPIRPAVMAAVLGAFYITTAPLFLLPLCAKRWENIRVMILPAALFCAVQLVATFLHWEKFTQGSRPFYVWFASYVLPPPILVAAYVWHQRRAQAPAPASDDPLPRWLFRLLVALGAAFTLFSVLVFAAPTLLMGKFPWTLSPLTARSLCGWLLLVGTLLLSMARENDRTRCRLAALLPILLLPALVLQLLRFSSQVNWSHPALWSGLLLFALVALCGLALARGSWRAALR